MSFVFQNMPFCCQSNSNEIEIVVANGSTENVFCRVTSDRILIKNQTGGAGLNVAGIAGIEGNVGVEYEHRAGGGDGYVTISPGNRMSFDSTGTPAYLTIVSEKGHKVCENHQVNRRRNFIVSKAFHLKESSKTNIWTDIEGKEYGSVDYGLENNSKPEQIGSMMSNPYVDANQLFNDRRRY